MKLLFTFIGGNGHFLPLLPIAEAARSTGHRVVFGCEPAMMKNVGALGFEVYALGDINNSSVQRQPLRTLVRPDEDDDLDDVLFTHLPNEYVRLRLRDGYIKLRDSYVRRRAHYYLPYIIELFKNWKPDVIVCDETNFSCMVGAEYLGLPYVNVLITAEGSFIRKEVISEVLDDLRATKELRPDPDMEMLWRHLVISSFPESFRNPGFPLPKTGYSICPPIRDKDGSLLLDWVSRISDAPTVYFTLGTIFNTVSGNLFEEILCALKELPINIIVTTGNDIDPEDLGEQPENVYIRSYIPQSKILPHCDLVISHGGSGSVSGALAYGKPLVLIPMGADQPLNAVRSVQLGIAEMLDPLEVTPDRIRRIVSAMLVDSTYAKKAESIRDEFKLLPDVSYAVHLIEKLVQ